MSVGNEHPGRLVERLGVSERPAGVTVGLVALLQYLFLAKLWLGYPLAWMGDVVHANVVAVGGMLTVGGAILIVWTSVRRWRRGAVAARRLERPAADPSFDPIRATLRVVARRAMLAEHPRLLYTPKNALALEVREGVGTDQAIVVGLGQRKDQRRDPVAFAAKLGHEVSHLELAGTRVEIRARRLVTLHLRVLGWTTGVFLLVLGFMDTRGLGSAPALGGFVAVFDPTIYTNLSAQFATLLLSSLIVLVYSYFFVARREHIHDVRGSQLAGTAALAERVFAPEAGTRPGTGLTSAVACIFALHPSPSARRRVILDRDFVLLSAVLYPAIMAGILPLSQLLVAGWRTEFAIEEHWWNLGQTIATGLALFMVLSADVSRLGLGILLDRQFWLRVPIYAVVAGLSTQVPRLVLEVSFGLRRGFTADVIVGRILDGVLAGGMNTALLVACLLVALAVLSGVRIAATGEERAGRWSAFDRSFTLLLAVGAFTISSLSDFGLIRDLLVLLGVVTSTYVALFALANRCRTCGRRRLSALRLRTLCACGHEHLATLRRFHTEPYDRQLKRSADPLVCPGFSDN